MTEEKLSPVQSEVAIYAIKKLVEHLTDKCSEEVEAYDIDKGMCMKPIGEEWLAEELLAYIEEWAALEFKEEGKK